METAKHTTGLWTANCEIISDSKGKEIARTDHRTRIEAYANARFIVTACNSHDTLVEACKSALRTLGALAKEAGELAEYFDEDFNDKWNECGYAYETCEQLRAALVAAGKEG